MKFDQKLGPIDYIFRFIEAFGLSFLSNFFLLKITFAWWQSQGSGEGALVLAPLELIIFVVSTIGYYVVFIGNNSIKKKILYSLIILLASCVIYYLL